MELKGSRTENNLMAAFSGEAMAYTKYIYYMEKAKEEGLNIVSKYFEETARNEKEHGELWFKLLHGGIQTTEVNLQDAINGENFEWTRMYEEFSRVAKEEGFNSIADLFDRVKSVEEHHEKRYQKLLDDLREHKLYNSDKEEKWVCSNCGYTHEAHNAPDACPLCGYPKGYFTKEVSSY